MKKRIIAPLFIIGVFITVFSSCKHDEPTPEDEQIFDEISTGTLYYYQGNDVILQEAGNSPHGDFKLRFNQTAWDALGPDGRLAQGSTFPDGSLIIKEVYDGSTLDLYAVMKKSSSSANAANGWLWNELNPDGSVIISVSQKGDDCISCHTGSTNRDLVRSFDLH